MTGRRAESDNNQATQSKSESPDWHNSVSMSHPEFNKMSYDLNKPARCLDGPTNPVFDDKHDNAHFRQIAKDGASFIAINGNINIAVKHALSEARKNDKADGTGFHSVDKLLSYMNKELCGTYMSVTRENNKFILLDSRDNQNLKHDKSGKALITKREQWNMDTEKYVPTDR